MTTRTEKVEGCTCGVPDRNGVKHRKTIPCWTYIGRDRYDVLTDGTLRKDETPRD